MTNEKRIKDFLTAIVIIICMLLPGICVDCLYYMRFAVPCIGDFVELLYRCLHPLGITYTSAMETIGGTVSIIMTMVSLFLSTNISLVQRSEKNTFGITYKEMQDVSVGVWQTIARWTKRISCVAPIFLMLVLNLRLCVTGYLLYSYCCASVFMQYMLYYSSFSREVVLQKAVNVLLFRASKEETWEKDTIQKFDIILSTMAKSVRYEGNWLEVEELFKILFQKIEGYPKKKRQVIINHFYRIVCCQQEDNVALLHRIWDFYIETVNHRAVGIVEQKWDSNSEKKDYFEKPELDWSGYWGMLQGAVPVLSEVELKGFIEELLEFEHQGIMAYEMEKESLAKPEQHNIKGNGGQVRLGEAVLENRVLEMRCFLLLVMLEMRFREKWPASAELFRAIDRLESFGNREIDRVGETEDEINDYSERCIKGLYGEGDVERIVFDLISDRKNGQSKCCISSMLSALRK